MRESHWNEMYNTGISFIDKQNKSAVEKIFELIANIKYKRHEDSHIEDFRKILSEMNENWHSEENLMEHFDYDRFDIHISAHKHFRSLLRKLKKYFDSGIYNEHLDIFKDLREGFLNHIDDEDKRFAKYMYETGHSKLQY